MICDTFSFSYSLFSLIIKKQKKVGEKDVQIYQKPMVVYF